MSARYIRGSANRYPRWVREGSSSAKVAAYSITWYGKDPYVNYALPVRNNTPYSFNYTFYDNNNNVLNLTSFAQVWLEIKPQGFMVNTGLGKIISTVLGTVTYPYYTFT